MIFYAFCLTLIKNKYRKYIKTKIFRKKASKNQITVPITEVATIVKGLFISFSPNGIEYKHS